MKLDLHNHSYYSIDASSAPEKIIKRAKEVGLDGIALTDHNTTKGWKEAEKAAKKYKILFIKGEEIKTKVNGRFFSDIVALFIKKEIQEKDPKKVLKEIKKQGGIAILPHPFHWVLPFKGDISKFKDFFDGVEVINARMPSKRTDKKALAFAKKQNMAMVGSSDSHYWRNVGDAYTIAEGARTLEDFREALSRKKTKAGGKKSSFISVVTTPLSRFKIIGKVPKEKY